MSDKQPSLSVRMAVDLAPIQELVESIDALQRRWSALPAPVRQSMARLVWLRPDGDVVQYRDDVEGGSHAEDR